MVCRIIRYVYVRSICSGERLLNVAGKVILTVLPPVETTGKEYSDVPELTEEIRQSMIKVYESTSRELGSCSKEE